MTIGPTFSLELIAAGLGGLPFSWDSQGLLDISQLTANQLSSVQTVLANHDPTKQLKNIVSFSDLVGRFTDAEYQLLMQKRAQVIAAPNTTNMFLIKQFDQVMSRGSCDLNTQAVQTFASSLVAAGILTQTRANTIFS